MKRAPLIAVLCVMCALPAAAQSVTVTRPPAPDNSPCIKGQTCTIAWTVTGQPGGPGIIELLEETTTDVVRTIKTDVQIANLQYAWTVPGDAAAGQFRVRVRVAWLVVSQPGSVFTIQAQSGGLHAGARQGVTLVAPLRVLEPTKTSVWMIGETHTIRWQATEAVKYPLWLFLVSADHRIPIVDIGKVGSAGYRPTQKSWTVTDNLFDQQYCIRITSADDPVVQVHSQPFQIKASRIVKFDVGPPAVSNQSHRHEVYTTTDGGPAFGTEFSTANLPPFPDPGGSIIKFGYQRWYEDSDNHGYRYHRSFVKFDLAGILAQQQHKWTVKSCSFAWNTAPGSPQVCPSAVYCLDGAMTDPHTQLFHPAFGAIPKHLIAGDPAVRAQMAQRWIDDPGRNYGLAILAANEGQPTENGQCIRFATIVLKLEIEEKLNK